MSLDRSVPTAASTAIDPARAWILGIVASGRRRIAAPIVRASLGHPAEAIAAAVVIRDDCACPDSCARDHDNE
jgi:hypothetical protein